MTAAERKQRFIHELAIFLVTDQARKSIELEMRNIWAQDWAILRNMVPLRGYLDVADAERILTEFLA